MTISNFHCYLQLSKSSIDVNNFAIHSISKSIFRQYHYEQPWPSAQAEIRRLAAYKTPQDKVACVVRCSQTIMNLLSIASTKSVPAADDFVPVMVFVIIKANPPSLLSTVQVKYKLIQRQIG